MNSLQIHRILSHDPVSSRCFAGVFPSDKIPVIRNYPCAMVINTDKHDERGTHWLAFYIENKNSIEFFDSLGLHPEAYGEDIARYVAKFPQIQWNKTKFNFKCMWPICIFFIVKRCQGFCMRFITNVLSTQKNDFRMFQFVKKRYGVSIIFKK